MLKRISNINLSPDSGYIRGGIIPVVTGQGGRKYYAFGLAGYSSEIFDIGGHMEKGEDPVQAAVREYYEESYGVFGDISVEEILDQDCEVWDGLDCCRPIPSLDILYPVDVDMLETVKEFQRIRTTQDNPELSQIIWLSSRDLNNIYKYIHVLKYRDICPFKTYFRLQGILTDVVRQQLI